MQLRWAILIAASVVSPSLVERAYASSPSSSAPLRPALCIKTVVRVDTLRICRAVLGGRLYVFYFVLHRGVWFLVSARPAVSLPQGTSQGPPS